MKTTVMQAVKAYLAADEMSRQDLPYDLALALVKVKQATRAEMEAYAAAEKKLVERYAALDEAGNVTIRNGRFTFRDPAAAAEYEAERQKLGQTQTEVSLPRLTATPPEHITPAALEALADFIKFREGGKRA